ncbi:MAG: class B sortase [Clostridia bacterium]|nr:class B sortase [Clostridia bacterium]
MSPRKEQPKSDLRPERNELRSRLQTTPVSQEEEERREAKKKSVERRTAAIRRAWLVVLIAAVACLAWVAVAAASELQEPPHPTLDIEGPLETPQPAATPEPQESASEQVPTSTPVPTPTPMIPEMAELYAQNPDLAGWIRIDGTVIDYPVMYTPDDGQFYLYRNFEREDDPSKQGCVFIDENCTIDPRSTNLLLHGHNMRNGSMFHSLVEYADPAYYAEHPTIQYTTLYDQQEYEIVYAFRSRVYNTNDDVFKYYKFYNAYTPEEFEAFIAGCEELALYDTGIEPEFGDEFLTLNTCEYTAENGRMVVVARRIKTDAERSAEAEPTADAVAEAAEPAHTEVSASPTRIEEIRTGPGLLRQ